MFTSTRPDCPVCKNGSLTDWLNNYLNDSLVTTCMICGARVIMTQEYKIIGWESYAKDKTV